MASNLSTERLLLTPVDLNMTAKVLEGEEALGEYLGVIIAQNWTEFGTAPFEFTREKLTAAPETTGWWAYIPILKTENILIGSGGYKGPPDSEGVVEIGYEIAPSFRNQGLATELSQALVQRAFQKEEITLVCAHTLGEVNPSTRVLEKLGFRKIAELEDPEEGTIWRWELGREEYSRVN